MKAAMKVLAVAIVMAALFAAYVSKRPEAPTGESSGGVSGSAVGGEATKPSPGTPENVEPQAAPAAATNGGETAVLGTPAVAEPVAPVSAGVGGVATAAAVPLEQGGEPDDVRAERKASGSAVSGGGAVERAAPVPALVGAFKRTASREGSVNGCSGGELVLSGSGLQFTCPSDSTKSVTLGLAEIERVDKSGVEANGHKKYHFNLQDADAAQGEELFREWLAEARTGR